MTDHNKTNTQAPKPNNAINQPPKNEANQPAHKPTEDDKQLQRRKVKNAKRRLKLRMQQTLPRHASKARPDHQLHITKLRRLRNAANKAPPEPRKEDFSSALDALIGITPVVSAFSTWGKNVENGISHAIAAETSLTETGDTAVVEPFYDVPMGQSEEGVEHVVHQLGKTHIEE
ncbi:hypothetical protein EG328_001773 [Venturia inaequalis]|uniref:Uncharacterized protein n=1 Tax=Venturia inaequalis TaxID=5025 RepID=A0A8H3UX05_VENIN|nr:hypothetical protein EG328_001773 [Venturia inaequalis]KAE9991433.1 hypothetical protein EG327_011662 [Venturia inaequalis]